MPPAAAAAAAIPAAVGAVPGIVAAATGAGKSNASSKNFTETPQYDPNRYEYSGRPGGADEAAGAARGNSNAAHRTAGLLLDEAAADRAMANGARDLSLGARNLQFGARDLSLEGRGRQAQMQNLMAERAKGRNLISTQVANRGRQDLGGRLAGMSASARGPAGLANAQNDAMAAQAQGLGQINANEQISSMQEQLAAEQAAFGAASGMRQGDDSLRQGDFTLRAGDDNMRGLDITQRGQSLQAAGQHGQLGLGYAGLENQIRGQQMQGNLEQQRIASGSKQAADQLNTGVNMANANRDMDYIKMIAGGTSGGAQSGMPMPSGGGGTGGGTPPPNASDPLAKTGIFGLGSGVGGGVDMGGDGSISGSDVQAASTGLSSGGGLGIQVGGGGITGGGGGPGGAGGGAGMGTSFLGISDPKAKWDVVPMSDMPGKSLQIGDDDRAFYSSQSQDDGRPSLEGPSPRYSKASDLSINTPHPSAAKAKERRMTDDEMLRAANAMGASMRSDHDARMAHGPAVSDPRAKEEAFRLGQQAGAMFAAKKYGGQPDILDIGYEEQLSPEQVAEIDADVRKNAPPSPHPLAPPPAPRGSISVDIGGAEMEKPGPTVEIGPAQIERRPMTGFRREARMPDVRSMIAPRPSDPRAKVLGGVHDNEVAQTLDATPAVSYRYKDERYEPDAQRPGEQQAGFLTTDLKKTPLGAAVVEKRPDGLEGYNEHRLNGLQHAEIRNLHERLRELESMIAGGGHGRR